MADLIAEWLHLMAAILWVGGNLTMSLAVQPVLRGRLKDASRFEVYREIGARFKIVMWGCWTVLLATGLFKLLEVRRTPALFLGPWGRVLFVKLILVTVMVILSLLHTYWWGPRLIAASQNSPDEAKKLVLKMKFWGTVNLIILAAIIFCAAALRFSFW